MALSRGLGTGWLAQPIWQPVEALCPPVQPMKNRCRTGAGPVPEPKPHLANVSSPKRRKGCGRRSQLGHSRVFLPLVEQWCLPASSTALALR